MLINQYQTLAQRTSPDGHDRLDNGILGLVGETGEIVDIYKKWKYQSTPETPIPRERMLEELGDVLWYTAELATGRGRTLGEILGCSFEDMDMLGRAATPKKRELRRVIMSMCVRAAEICEHAHKKRFDRVDEKLRNMMAGMAILANICGSSLEAVAEMNIEKLKKRYPDGFDPKISMGRYE